MSRPESLWEITPSESGADVRTRVTFLVSLALCNLSSSEVHETYRNPRRSSCCRLPLRRPRRLPKSPTIHRREAYETRIPGVSPTKLHGFLAHLVQASCLESRRRHLPKHELLALQKRIDAADGDLHVHLGFLNLDQKSANEITSNGSNKGRSQVPLVGS